MPHAGKVGRVCSSHVRFAHVNLIAQDWKRLVAFYERVFHCTAVPPERDLGGPWLEASTRVEGARIRGLHLRLPGYGDHGPTLEVFQYSRLTERGIPAPNRPGLAHIAFAVDDVETVRQAVIAAGGGSVGETVTAEIPNAGRITFAYVTDPEGNIIELQRWSA